METQSSTLQTFRDQAHEAYLKQLKDSLLRHAGLQGEQNGKENMPVTIGQFKAFILNKIQATIQSGINSNQQLLQPISGRVIANKIQNDAQSKVAELQSAINNGQHKKQQLQNEARNCKPDIKLSRTRKLILLMLTCIALSDGWFAYPAFRHMGMPTVAAFVACCGVAIAVGAGAHNLASFIRKATTKSHMLLRYLSVLSLYFTGFAIIGFFRAVAYNHVSNLQVGTHDIVASHATSVSGLGIALVSFLLFWLGLFLSVKFWISADEQRQQQEYEDTCKELQEADTDLKKKHDEIHTIQAEKNTLSGSALAKYEYAVAIEKGLLSFSDIVIQAYIDKNMRFRSDNNCPEFFSNPPKLQYTLFFDTLKNSSK